MFKAPFSFEGRIRRTEYGLSVIIYAVALVIIQLFLSALMMGSSSSYSSSNDEGGIIVMFLIFSFPILWFLWAQGAKRCHDLGNSGWWQLIPFYGLWLLFDDGQFGPNQYGDNPKGIQVNTQVQSAHQVNSHQQNQNNPGAGYQGGYSGGHNNPNSTSTSIPNQSNNGEYQSGDMYR